MSDRRGNGATRTVALVRKQASGSVEWKGSKDGLQQQQQQRQKRRSSATWPVSRSRSTRATLMNKKKMTMIYYWRCLKVNAVKKGWHSAVKQTDAHQLPVNLDQLRPFLAKIVYNFRPPKIRALKSSNYNQPKLILNDRYIKKKSTCLQTFYCHVLLYSLAVAAASETSHRNLICLQAIFCWPCPHFSPLLPTLD